MEKTKCLIIGSGPAGYTAAIYAARANLYPVLYMGMEPGGQLTTTTEVDNFPGYPKGITGTEMMEDLKNQALRFGTDIRSGRVTQILTEEYPFEVKIDGEISLLTEAIIIATGASAKYLGLPSEAKFKGMGVSACATCDGFFYRGKVVAVVGGGDTACEEASYLSTLCEKVFLIVRKTELKASKAMQKRVLENNKIEVCFGAVTDEVLGDNSGVTGLRISVGDVKKDLTLHGVFIAIGHTPNTKVVEGVVDLDANGYIITKGKSSKTSVEGIFAAGDVQDPIYRQAITSAGDGCRAAIDMEKFFNE